MEKITTGTEYPLEIYLKTRFIMKISPTDLLDFVFFVCLLFRFSIVLIKSKLYICNKIFSSGIQCSSVVCPEILMILNYPICPLRN